MPLNDPVETDVSVEGRLTRKASEERARWFGQHVLPHEPGLRSWLRRRRLETCDIHDLVQETYAILASRERVDDIRNPRAYLFQVAHSLVVRNSRRARIVPFVPLEDFDQSDEAAHAISPERIAIARDELRRLAGSIQAMPARTRAAFIMRRVEGLSQREIAARMMVSESTVEKHISKGLQFLMERFGRSGNGLLNTSMKVEQGIIRLGARPRPPSDDR